MLIKEVKQYFDENNFMESLVLNLAHRNILSKVNLVCDYANDAVQATLRGEKPPLKVDGFEYHRDFRKLVFEQVENFQYTSGQHSIFTRGSNFFNSEETARSVMIQQLELENLEHNKVYLIKLSLGAFGKLKFSFGELHVYRVLAFGTQISNEPPGWIYKDIYTSKTLNFHNPFNDSVVQAEK